MDINSKKRRSERGNAAVETVLVIVPLIMVLIAIIDVSLAIFIMDTLEFAARQGVRYAITGQTSGALQQNASIRKVVRDNSMGFLSDTTKVPDSNITITYYSLVTTGANANTWQKVTGANSNANGNLVRVSVVGFNWAWMMARPIGKDSSGNFIWGAPALSMNAASADISSACTPTGCPALGP